MDVSHAIYPFMCQMSVGSNKNRNSLKINIYPNPTNGNLYLICENYFKDVKIEILDSRGSEVIKKEYLNLNQTMIKINMDKFSKGIYYIRIATSGELYTEKIVLTE